MDELKSCKDAYHSTFSDEDLSAITKRAIILGHQQRYSNKRMRQHSLKLVASTLAACFVLFFVANSNLVFAQTIRNVPLLGDLLKIFTVDFYIEEKEESYLHVTIPELKNTGNTALETSINKEIRLRIDEMIAASEQEAKDYRQAYLETGGTLEDAWKMEIIIDYEIYSSNDEFVSFVLSKTQSLASVYTEYYYYNIELSTGNTITLENLFGEDYEAYLNTYIIEEMRHRFSLDHELFFSNEDGTLDESHFVGISKEQGFYITENDTVIIVFPKYALAPGYQGETLFEISMD